MAADRLAAGLPAAIHRVEVATLAAVVVAHPMVEGEQAAEAPAADRISRSKTLRPAGLKFIVSLVLKTRHEPLRFNGQK